MLDPRFLIAHGLWIAGAATMLAALGYYDWLAKARGRTLRTILREERGWTLSVSGGLVLVACGFLLMESTRWWERGVWLAVLGGAGYDLWCLWRK